MQIEVYEHVFRYHVPTLVSPHVSPGAVVCVAIVNRFEGDQVTTSKDTLTEWEWNPARLVARLIRKHQGDTPITL